MTTIGYGDFVLSSNAMKLVFSFIGCCTLVIYICLANKFRGDWHKDFLRHQLEKVEAAYVRNTTLRQIRSSRSQIMASQEQTVGNSRTVDTRVYTPELDM